MLTKMVIDSSFLYALFESKTNRHEEVADFMATTLFVPIVPYVVLGEVTFLFNRAGGAPAMRRFLDAFVQFDGEFEGITREDLQRVSEILAQYPRAKLDFVDCCIVSIAERLNIKQVCTLDIRDFGIIRTRDGTFLEVLP